MTRARRHGGIGLKPLERLREIALEESIDENRNKEVGPAHSCKNQPCQAEDGPECHFQFAVRFLRMLECHGEGKSSRDETQRGKNSEDDQEDVVGHFDGEGTGLKFKK